MESQGDGLLLGFRISPVLCYDGSVLLMVGVELPGALPAMVGSER